MKRIMLIFLCLACLAGTAACQIRREEKSPRDPAVSYAPVIEAYCALVQSKANAETLTLPADTASAMDKALYGLVNTCEDPTALGYAIKDINQDGISELVLLTRNSGVFALFTLEEDTPTLLLHSQVSAAIYPDGTVCSMEYDPNAISCIRVQTLEDGELVGLEYGTVPDGEGGYAYYKIEDGVRSEITWEEVQHLDYMHHIIGSDFAYINKTSGFRFIPAIPAEPSDNPPPAADFSSYEAILSAYRTIVEQFADCTRKKWTAGEYDNLFTITNNTDYEIFHSLFYNGFTAKPTTEMFGSEYPHNGNDFYGYAQKDLDGDGVEELFIMDHDYQIRNVFTMVDGRPVHLPEGAGCWLDENGRFHKRGGTGGVVGRDGEAYIYELRDGALCFVTGVGYKVNVYLQNEGWYRIEDGKHLPISDEEGEELYKLCVNLPLVCVEREYTRMHGGLTFQPLFERTVAHGFFHEDTYVNSSYSAANQLVVSDITDDVVTFALDHALYVGETDPEHPELGPEEIRTLLEGKATRDKDGRYVFEVDGVKGYLEFTVTSVWVVITESENPDMICRAYLLNDHEREHP